MTSERYLVVIYGIDSKYYTNEYVAYVWDNSAMKEYNRSNIYVTARIDVNILVCGSVRECTLGDTAHVITVVRNPAESDDTETFKDSFLNVLYEVRQKLDNPSMTISVDTIDYFYFI